jgi:hypothetical protein
MLARTLIATALALPATVAVAQAPAQSELDPTAATRPPYRSAFDGYRPYVEEPVAPWREVNDTVGRVGGHVGVLRAEDVRVPPQPAAPAAPPPAAKEQSHDAHHRK